MLYLSYLEGVARIRERVGFAHIADAMIDLHRMLAAGHFAVVDIGYSLSDDGRAYRAIFFHHMCTIEPISYRDCQAASLRHDGINLRGGPIDLPLQSVLPAIVLGSVECLAESSEIALNFARPFRVRLEVRTGTKGRGTFILLFAIEYEGRLLRCKSSPALAELSGGHQVLEFDVPEVKTVDPEVAGFLEAATYVRLASVFFALGSELEAERVALQSNWAFGFLPANYVD